MKKRLVTSIVVLVVLAVATIAVTVKIFSREADDGIRYPATAFTDNSVLKETGRGSDVTEMSLSVKNYDLAAEYPYIEVTWKNDTEKRATYGLGYDVQRKIDGVWTSCAIDSIIVPSIACMIAPGEENSHSYNLSYFDIDKNTEYRFITECYFSEDDTGDYPDKCNMYVEFNIT